MASRRSASPPARVVLGLAWVALCAASLPEITDEKFIEECVSEHNRARANVQPPANDMLYMSWDEALAVTARAWARRCDFRHNIFLKEPQRVHPSFPSVGENIWTGYPPSHFSVVRAVNHSWVGEEPHYSYATNGCGRVCGHYTQVVWASSYKVGCAVQLCPNGVKNTNFKSESAIFVCDYAPGGNFAGRKPYGSGGAACSRCEGRCKDNLCQSKERDSRKSYNWSPDWDSAGGAGGFNIAPDASNSVATGSNYEAVLIARPIALIATFLAAYVVHRCYPNMFFYE